MNLHEIIHQYLQLGPVIGDVWLRTLIQDAGLDVVLVRHIRATA